MCREDDGACWEPGSFMTLWSHYDVPELTIPLLFCVREMNFCLKSTHFFLLYAAESNSRGAIQNI